MQGMANLSTSVGKKWILKKNYKIKRIEKRLVYWYVCKCLATSNQLSLFHYIFKITE